MSPARGGHLIAILRQPLIAATIAAILVVSVVWPARRPATIGLAT
jgi:hypothetical protein